MARNSYMQNSFLSGEFSPYSQGQSDTKDYYSGMNLCLNYIPTDEGACVRRPGFRFSAEARSAANVKLIPFYTADGSSYICEFTPLFLRFHANGGLVTDLLSLVNVISISTATPAVVTTSAAHGFTTGDTVVFPRSSLSVETAPLLFNRQFRITVLSSTTFEIAHTGSLGSGGVDGSVFDGVIFLNEQVTTVTEIATFYPVSRLEDLRHTEESDTLYIFHPDNRPYTLEGATLAFNANNFIDGPYLDQNETATTLSFSGTTGSVTVTASASLFASTDVNRLIRINTGTETDPDWSWLRITAFSTATSVTATILGEDLASGAANTKWRLGLYSATTGWPRHGVVHDGRMYMIADQAPGRVDGSVPFDFFNFAPTEQDGTVTDGNGVSITAAGTGRKTFRWLQVREEGLFAGSDSREWRVRASVLDDPITPFTIQIRPTTSFGAYDALPVLAGRNSLFIQSLGRSLMEYRIEGGAADGTDLARKARHLTTPGLEELAYSQVPSPIVWVRRQDNRLIGLTYRNDVEGKQTGWHRHNVAWDSDTYDQTKLEEEGLHEFVSEVGDVVSIAVAPFSDFEATRTDTLWAAIRRNGQACVEYLTPVFDLSKDPNESFHVDSGNLYKQDDLGITWQLIDADTSTYRFYGLDRLVGDTIDVVFRGVDLGTAVVQVGGYIDAVVPDALDSTAAAYESSAQTQIAEGGMTASTAFVSEHRATGTSGIGNPCPQSTIIEGEDGNRYYVRGGVAGIGGDANNLTIHNADTGALAFTKSTADVGTDATGEGLDHPGGSDGNLAVAIPETPYILVITGGVYSASNMNKLVMYYKINAASALEFMGGMCLYTDTVGNTQFSPPDAFGASAVAAGHLPCLGTSGANNNIPYKYPVVLAYYGESRSTLMAVPSINYILANSPVNINATNPWFTRELGLSTTDYEVDIFALGDSPLGTSYSRGFFLPVGDDNGALFFQNFYVTDLEAHSLGTESVNNGFLDVHASTYVTGLVSALRLFISGNTDDGALVAGEIKVSMNANIVNADGTPAFPFEDDGQKYDGTPGDPAENYYCGGWTVYPSDLSDPSQPYYVFAYRTYRATGDRDKGGVRVLKWDPMTLKFTNLDFAKAQIFTLGSDVAAGTDICAGNVQWDRSTGQLTLLLRSAESGAKALIVSEFGTFDPQMESITVVDADHVDGVLGLNYYSRGQKLRPEVDSGAQSGAALGKIRRTDRFHGLFNRTGQIKFGTKFTDLKDLVVSTLDALGRRKLFSGVSPIKSLQDGYSYDSMMAWEQSRPDPGCIVAVSGHVSTQDV